MSILEIRPQDMTTAQTVIPENANILMLNLLKYKPQAEYGEGQHYEPCTGREAYFNRYVPIFLELAASYKEIKPFFIGKVLAGLVPGKTEQWENVGLIAYPNFKSFQDLVESDAYIEKALPHRLAALEDWKLFVTVAASPV